MQKNLENKVLFKREFISGTEEVANMNTVSEAWEGLKDKMHKATTESYGCLKYSNKDWVQSQADILIPVLNVRKKALLN